MERIPQIVFIAEDDEDDVELFIEIVSELEPRKEITVAHNGHHLMENLSAHSEKPSIIFLDLNMPKKNGMECLQEIKANPLLRGVPVIILTTSPAKESIEKAYQLGANYYIVKPTIFETFKKMMDIIFHADYSKPVHREEFFMNKEN